MTTSHDLPFLLTDADVLARVRELVGPAITDRQLWLMFVDGDGRQAPVLVPVADLPARPDELVPRLGALLSGIVPGLRTGLGRGSVILTLERHGPDATRPSDRDWAQALTDACIAAAVDLRGVFLSTRGGVRRLL